MRKNFLVMLMLWLACACSALAQAPTLQQQAQTAVDKAAFKAWQLAAVRSIVDAARARGKPDTADHARVLRSSLSLLADIEGALTRIDVPARQKAVLAKTVILPVDRQAAFQSTLVRHYKQVLEQIESIAIPQNERIILGTLQRDPLFPGIVAIRDPRGRVCTGIFFKPDKVLTAAHCVCDLNLANPGRLHSVTFGDHFRTGSFLGGNRIIRKILRGGTSIYPGLPGASSSYCSVYPTQGIAAAGTDLALITLAPDAALSAILAFPETQLAAADDLLATTSDGNENIRPFFAVGFGKSETWKRLQMRLSVSGAKRGTTILNGNICPDRGTFGGEGNRCLADREVAAFDASGRDSCAGDSGGPLFVRDSTTTQWLLAGITSRGMGAGDGCGQGGIYSLVIRQKIRAWMQNNGVTFGQ